MKATTLLKKDHVTVRKLFSAYEKADRKDQKMKLFDEIAMELDLHMKVEEEIFYPPMKKEGDEEGVEHILEALEEHGVVKTILAKLSEMTPSDETFDAKMKVVKESVEHHVEEEEEEMFPDAEETLGQAALEELAARIEQRKVELGGR